jgi:hypothetical protein
MIKKTSLIVALLGLVALPAVSTLRAAPVTIENGTVWKDTDGNEILCQGGSIYQEDGTFYWVGQEMQKDSTRLGIRCYSSTDLKNWTNRGYIISVGQGPGFEPGKKWMGRPSLIRNPITKKYVLVLGLDREIAFAESDTIYGKNYTLKGTTPVVKGSHLCDQATVQFGADAYLILVHRGNEEISIFKLDPASYLKVDSLVYTGFNDGGVEAPYIIQKDGKYLWFGSCLAEWKGSPTLYAVADSLAGPWAFQRVPITPKPATLKKYNHGYLVPAKGADGKVTWQGFPIYQGDDSYDSQLDFIVPVTGSEGTTYMYCGDRWSNRKGFGTGRYVWLPLSWEGNVPTMHLLKSWTIDTATGKWSTAESEQTKSN